MEDSGLKAHLVSTFLTNIAVVDLVSGTLWRFAVKFARRFIAIGRFFTLPVAVGSVADGLAIWSGIHL